METSATSSIPAQLSAELVHFSFSTPFLDSVLEAGLLDHTPRARASTSRGLASRQSLPTGWRLEVSVA